METDRLNKLVSIVVFLLIFVSEDILIFGTLDNALITSLRYVVQIGSFLVIFLFFKENGINKKNLLISIFFITLIFISALMNQDFRMGYLFLVFLFFLCAQVRSLVSIRFVLEMLYKSMLFISSFSVVLFFLRLLIPESFSIFPVIKNISGADFYFCFFSNFLVNTGGFLRNYGPFREPGVYQMFLILALMYGIFLKKKPDLRSMIMMLLALFTTFSTTAYISIIILFLAFLLEDRRDTRPFNISVICFFIISLLYMAFFTDLLYRDGYGSVFGKMFGAYESASMNARSASVWVNVEMLKNNPLWGNGISYVDENFPSLAYSMFGIRVQDNTNGILIMFARFGVLFGVLYFWRIIAFAFQNFSNKLIVKTLLSISLLTLYFGETLTYSVLFTLLLFCNNEDSSLRRNA